MAGRPLSTMPVGGVGFHRRHNNSWRLQFVTPNQTDLCDVHHIFRRLVRPCLGRGARTVVHRLSAVNITRTPIHSRASVGSDGHTE